MSEYHMLNPVQGGAGPRSVPATSLCRRAFGFGAAMAFVQTALSFMPYPAQCADFSQAQQTYVPPSLISRRYDLGAQSGVESDPSSYDASVFADGPASDASAVDINGLSSQPSTLSGSVTQSNGDGTSKAWVQPFKSAYNSVSSSPSFATVSSTVQSKVGALIKTGNFGGAEQLLKSDIRQFPQAAKFKTLLGEVAAAHAKSLYANRQLDLAAKEARTALAADFSNAQAQDTLDKILTKKGINAQDPQARLKLADQFFAKHRYTEAAVEYRTSIKLEPSAKAYIGLGNSANALGHRHHAQAEFQQALQLEPNNQVANRQLGITEYSLNELAAANMHLNHAISLNGKDKVASAKLVELWQAQVSEHPKDANSHYGLARAYQLSGDLKEAQSEYRNVVAINPNFPHLAAARASFKIALNKQEASNYFTAAQTLDNQGAPKAAYEKVVQAVKLDPTNVPQLIYKGSLSEKLGNQRQAHDSYMTALKYDPTNTTAAQRLTQLPTFEDGTGTTASTTTFSAPASPVGLQAQEGQLDTVAPLSPPIPQSQALSTPTQASAFMTNQAEAPPAATIPPPTAALAQAAGAVNQAMAGLAGSSAQSTATQATATASAASSQADHIATLGSFLGQMRTAAAAHQKQWQAAEDAMHTAMGDSPSSLSSSSSSLGSLSSLSAAASTSSAVSSPISPTASSSFLSTLGGAAAALSSTPLMRGAQSAATTSAVTSSVTIPGTSVTITPDNLPAYQQMLAQNPQLQAQAQQYLAQNPALQAQIQQMLAQSQTQPAQVQAQPQPQIAPTAPTEQIALRPAQSVPSQAVAPPAANSSSSSSSLNFSSGVAMELRGVKPSASNIKLKVVLRNDQDVPLSISRHMKATVRMRGLQDRQVKVTFDSKTVGPHAQMQGTIVVPGHNLNPTADVFIPNLVSATTQSGTSDTGDVHLTVPISALPPR